VTVAFRPADRADRSFICDAWVSSYRFAHTAGFISMERWHRVMWQEVEHALDRPTTTTIVAYEPEETDRRVDLQGFIVFVKENYRRAGYAAGLLNAIGIDARAPFLYACKTAVVAELARLRKIPCARFDPIAARYPSKTPPRRDHVERSETIIEQARPRSTADRDDRLHPGEGHEVRRPDRRPGR
jgi:GNAT superfamily N-acetyltransferase